MQNLTNYNLVFSSLALLNKQTGVGFIGSLALKAVVNNGIERTYSLAGCIVNIVAPGPNGLITIRLGTSQALWLEIICSFVFLFASAGNGIVEDEESLYGRNKAQPLTSMQEQFKEGQDPKSPLLTKVLGLEELFSLEVWRASLAELLGTAVLVFMLDTIVISTLQTETKTPNLVMSVLIAFVVAVLLLATYPVSGGHINPIVTFGALLTGLISISKAAIFILAQCVGGILGALALKAVINSNIERAYSLGGCTVTIVAQSLNGSTTIGLGTSQALWLEIFCAFVFLFASVWMAFDSRQAKAVGRVMVCVILGIVLGLLVYISTTVTATKGYGGAGLNPARCFGSAIVRGGHLWNRHWIFWVGPAIGCAAFALYVKMIPTEHTHSY
ncbi:hypothetical protein REPUB_Repub04eG0046300 [Reevesia pubescens]